MDTWIWALIGVAIVVVVFAAVAAWWWSGYSTRRQRSTHLRAEFGPEYDHTIHRLGRRRGEADLEARKRRVSQLDLRPLEPTEAERFRSAWMATQARFVDEPSEAITEADHLVAEVMQLRGYPVGDFESRAADVSVDHPEVVTSYRTAHDIALANDAGEATTEELRQAMVQYRSLFRELLEVEDESTPIADRRSA